jgi:hypothetical protein
MQFVYPYRIFQEVAMALAAAIGAALLVIWHPPGILNAYRCMHYSVAGWCSEMWRVDIGPTLGWIVLGATQHKRVTGVLGFSVAYKWYCYFRTYILLFS